MNSRMWNFLMMGLIIIGIIIIFLTFDMVRKSNHNTLNYFDLLFKQNELQIKSVNKEIAEIRVLLNSINLQIDSLNQENKKTILRINNEIRNIDELFKNSSDSVLVNAVLRYWSERLYKLPGYFQTSVDNN